MIHKLSKQLVHSIELHEGFRAFPYKDTKGIMTCGYGYNLEANTGKLSSGEIGLIYKHGISRGLAEFLMLRELQKVYTYLLRKLLWFSLLDDVRAETLVEMGYNLGCSGLMKFKKTLALLEQRKYYAASVEMLDSNWADDVGDRAVALSRQIKFGVYAA